MEIHEPEELTIDRAFFSNRMEMVVIQLWRIVMQEKFESGIPEILKAADLLLKIGEAYGFTKSPEEFRPRYEVEVIDDIE